VYIIKFARAKNNETINASASPMCQVKSAELALFIKKQRQQQNHGGEATLLLYPTRLQKVEITG